MLWNVYEIEELELVHLLDFEFRNDRFLLYFISTFSIQSSKTPSINPLSTNVPNHIETSQLIWNKNQLIGFYMIGNVCR